MAMKSKDDMDSDDMLSAKVKSDTLGHEERISMILAYLENVLDPDEFAEVQYMLTSAREEDPRGPLPSNLMRGAMDRLPPRLRQLVAKSVLNARNSDANSYADAFPTVSRIKGL